MAKGQYFNTTQTAFKHLIYPAFGKGAGYPSDANSGGGAFWPRHPWVDSPSYDVNPADADKFHRPISTYWPALQRDELIPAWAGLRPKIWPDGSHFQDFTFHDASATMAVRIYCPLCHGSPGLRSVWLLPNMSPP